MNCTKSENPFRRSNQRSTENNGACEPSPIGSDALPVSRESQIIAPMYSTRIGKARHKVRIEPRLVVVSGANRGMIVWLDKDRSRNRPRCPERFVPERRRGLP